MHCQLLSLGYPGCPLSATTRQCHPGCILFAIMSALESNKMSIAMSILAHPVLTATLAGKGLMPRSRHPG